MADKREPQLVIPPRPPLPATAPRTALPAADARPSLPKPAPAAFRPAEPLRPAPAARLARLVREPGAWLAAYGLVLAAIAFWPAPVDSGAGPFLRRVEQLFPVLSYARIEFGANILLFVPLGLLLALLFPRSRWIVMPLAFVTTVAIESVQALALDRRTPSVLDIVANTAGACVGLLIAAFVAALQRGRTTL